VRPIPGTADNQLNTAVDFLQAHPHQVVLITIDIGANDIDHCISLTGIDSACVQQGFSDVSNNLPVILSTLHSAAPGTPIVAMNYYDPFLAAWELGPAGKVLGDESLLARWPTSLAPTTSPISLPFPA
jgi:lysophospholipase L1-like esterase